MSPPKTLVVVQGDRIEVYSSDIHTVAIVNDSKGDSITDVLSPYWLRVLQDGQLVGRGNVSQPRCMTSIDDENASLLRQLIRAFKEIDPGQAGKTTREIGELFRQGGNACLNEVVFLICGGTFNPSRFGSKLKSLIDRVVDGQFIVGVSGHAGLKRWFVKSSLRV